MKSKELKKHKHKWGGAVLLLYLHIKAKKIIHLFQFKLFWDFLFFIDTGCVLQRVPAKHTNKFRCALLELLCRMHPLKLRMG